MPCVYCTFPTTRYIVCLSNISGVTRSHQRAATLCTELHHSISATTQPACPQANTCLSVQCLQCATIASYSPLHMHSYPPFTPLACSGSPSYPKHSCSCYTAPLIQYCLAVYILCSTHPILSCLVCVYTVYVFPATRYIVVLCPHTTEITRHAYAVLDKYIASCSKHYYFTSLQHSNVLKQKFLKLAS